MTHVTAFLRDEWITSGVLPTVIETLQSLPGGRAAQVFDDETGELIKLSNRVEIAAALEEPHAARGFIALGVTLLPRHVEWLESQSGGPSSAIRRLIEAARRDGVGRDRQARDAAYRFISMMAGDLPGFEEACRALYAGDLDRFEAAARLWSPDVRRYARGLAGDGWVTVTPRPAP